MIRIYIILAIVTTISVGGFFAYKFVTNLITENATISANNKILTSSLKSSQDANKALQEDVKLQGTIITTVNAERDEARQSVRKLEEKLGKHELGFLAKNKPVLVEKVINNASDNIGRCFEIATGSPLTVKEANATKPSQINSECPEFFPTNK